MNTYRANRKNPWEYTWVEFDGLKAKGLLEQAGISSQNPVYHPSSPEGGQAIAQLMLYIARHSQASSLHLIGHLYLFMEQLVTNSSNRRKAPNSKISHYYVKEAISFIEQNYSRNLTVEELASMCKLDRSYFGKIFKDCIGKSPQDFLIQYRMARAAEQLTLTDDSIGEISSSVGYPNQLHFSRAFKKVYGIPPREYRQKYKIIPK